MPAFPCFDYRAGKNHFIQVITNLVITSLETQLTTNTVSEENVWA